MDARVFESHCREANVLLTRSSAARPPTLDFLCDDDDRLDDKDSVDIHDNPPLPDNVVKEEDNTVRRPVTSMDKEGPIPFQMLPPTVELEEYYDSSGSGQREELYNAHYFVRSKFSVMTPRPHKVGCPLLYSKWL